MVIPEPRQAPPAAWTVSFAGWRCTIVTEEPDVQRWVTRLFGAYLRPSSELSGTRILVKSAPESPGIMRLRLLSRGEPCDMLAALSGPAWKRFQRIACEGAPLYADLGVSGEPALRSEQDGIVVLQRDRWPLYLELAFAWLLLRETRVVGLHAAVVGWAGHALVLIGPSGAGKSTLSLALSRLGADFFGDEWAFFTREPYELHVLPEPLRLRPGGAVCIGEALLGDTLAQAQWREARRGDPKWVIQPPPPTAPCPRTSATLLFLDGFAADPSLVPIAPSQAVRRLLTGLSCGDASLTARLEICAALTGHFPTFALPVGTPGSTARLLCQYAGERSASVSH